MITHHRTIGTYLLSVIIIIIIVNIILLFLGIVTSRDIDFIIEKDELNTKLKYDFEERHDHLN